MPENITKTKVCSRCGEEYTNGNAFHKLCWKCNDLRLHDLEAFRGHENKNVNNVSKYKNKSIRRAVNSVKTNAISIKHEVINPYNVKSEKELFKIIWDSRPHICEFCGKKLGNEMKAHFFSHRLAKSISPWRRLDPSNIDLLCIDCHTQHDFGKRKTHIP